MPHAVHEAIFRSQPDEHAFVVRDVEGTIPPDLAGTFLRTGPGLMRVGEADLSFFDGHALIAGVTFEGGAARFRSRFVRTPLFEKETAQKAVLQRRVFTNRPARWANLFALELGNSAMHDVYAWGEGEHARVIAGNDLGHFALDARTLATKGPETLGGAAEPGHEVGPMPYRDPRTGHLITWVKRVGGLRPDAVRFVELEAASRVVRSTPLHALGGSPVLLHDQRATAAWYVATEQSLRLSVGSAVWGARTVYESLATPKGATATILLVPRGGEGPMIRVPLPSPHEIAFHVINAFDEGTRVIVDLVTYDGRIGFEAAAPRTLRERTGHAPSHGPRPTPWRFVVDPSGARVVESRRLGDASGEAPEVADGVMGAPYRYAYMPTAAPDEDVPDRGGYFYFGALAKTDVVEARSQTWRAAPGSVVSPCAFVARPGATREDEGWLLSYVLREDGARVVILDASAMESGPVATLSLGIHLPGVSHTRWAEGVRLDG